MKLRIAQAWKNIYSAHGMRALLQATAALLLAAAPVPEPDLLTLARIPEGDLLKRAKRELDKANQEKEKAKQELNKSELARLKRELKIDGVPTYGSVTLKSGFLPDPFSKAVYAGGKIVTRFDAVKAYIAEAPVFRLDYEAGKYPLTIYVWSGADTTLLVHRPDGSWIADDDSGGNLNPLIRFDRPQSGRYDVYVGTVGPQLAPATLYITELPVTKASP